jgi:hypothetical protein
MTMSHTGTGNLWAAMSSVEIDNVAIDNVAVPETPTVTSVADIPAPAVIPVGSVQPLSPDTDAAAAASIPNNRANTVDSAAILPSEPTRPSDVTTIAPPSVAPELSPETPLAVAPAAVSPAAVSPAELAFTGRPVLPIALAGSALIALGVAISRRRST